jgi:hypothetical protein
MLPTCQSAPNTFHLSASNTFHFFSPLLLAFALFEPVRIVAGFQNVAVMRDAMRINRRILRFEHMSWVPLQKSICSN